MRRMTSREVEQGALVRDASWSHRWLMVIVFAVIGGLWGALQSGIVSSNDGSHVALARALSLRHTTRLGEDAPLTLGVDLAQKDGEYVSDRPPGTAMLALPLAWLGGTLDAADVAGETLASLQPPAGRLFAYTYTRRAPGAPPLRRLSWTSLLLGLHVGTMGLMTLALVWCRLIEGGVRRSAAAVGVAALGLGSLLGPYATMLFCHVPAAFALALADWSGARMAASEGGRRAAFTMGIACRLACITDYLLVLVVLGMVGARCGKSELPAVVAGLAIVVGVGAAYHTVAFGAPWSIGYDYQVNFGFARARADTFSGDPVDGLVGLLGVGDGGVLAVAPLWILALGATLWPTRARTAMGRVWLERGAWLLWFGMLCMHQTPMGGAFHDHRYLIPVFPMLAVTLADRLDGLAPRYRGRGRAAVVILIVASSLGVWSHIIAAREQPAFTGRVAWIVLALIGAGIGYWMQRRVTASSDAVRPG